MKKIGFFSILITVVIMLSTLMPAVQLIESPVRADAGDTKTIGELAVGDRVVDSSWAWKHKTGDFYTGEGEIKPVTWIVVAKNHYDVEGNVSHVTLLAEGLIGLYAFDDAADRDNSAWGESGKRTAEHGIRPFLNSFNQAAYSYTGEGFFDSMSEAFQDRVVNTFVPNKHWDTKEEYKTVDRVFIPSGSEVITLDIPALPGIGDPYPYFNVPEHERTELLKAELGGATHTYWTRSPVNKDIAPGLLDDYLTLVNQTGNTGTTGDLGRGNVGIRPALNLDAATPVAAEPTGGVYQIVVPEPTVIGDLQIGDRVVDPTWKWEYRESALYTGSGESSPVTWIVVAKNHYAVEGGKPHVTLISEDLIAYYIFDNSTNRNGIDEPDSGWNQGSNHWGDSGKQDASHGIRAFLNSLDPTGYNYQGEGFLAAMGNRFRNAVLSTEVPNATRFNENREWSDVMTTYVTEDKVFVFSRTELGDTVPPGYTKIGTPIPYFMAEENVVEERRKAKLPFRSDFSNYYTRSPGPSGSSVNYVTLQGMTTRGFATNNLAVRPALNINAGLRVSQKDEGIFEIEWPSPKPIIELDVGDRVVDPSWEWEFKYGRNYSNLTLQGDPLPAGETRPVNWIVAGKNHFDIMSAHVTLLSEELVALHAFDDSSRNFDDTHPFPNGNNHWGNSGTPDAGYGLRPFLNSLDKSDSYSYSGNGFYSAFSPSFRNVVLNTVVHNSTQIDSGGNWSGDNTWSSYTTEDHVFILSHTEMGGVADEFSGNIGDGLAYFNLEQPEGPRDTDELEARRSTKLDGLADAHGSFGGDFRSHWSRSPSSLGYNVVRSIHTDGYIGGCTFMDTAEYTYGGVRPAVNICAYTYVIEDPHNPGFYEIFKGGGLYGDINNDGHINIVDAVILLRHILGLIDIENDFGPEALIRGRVGQEGGAIDIQDAILTLQFITKKIDFFPVEDLSSMKPK